MQSLLGEISELAQRASDLTHKLDTDPDAPLALRRAAFDHWLAATDTLLAYCDATAAQRERERGLRQGRQIRADVERVPVTLASDGKYRRAGAICDGRATWHGEQR